MSEIRRHVCVCVCNIHILKNAKTEKLLSVGEIVKGYHYHHRCQSHSTVELKRTEGIRKDKTIIKTLNTMNNRSHSQSNSSGRTG